MSKKKRMAIAVALSATAGSTAGYVASYYGLDVEESTRLGAVVSGAVGNLLYQVFRPTPDQANATGAPDTATGPAAVSGNNNGSTAVPDTANVPNVPDMVNELDTVDAPEAGPEIPSVRPPVASASEDRKHPRHRKLRRAGRRRIERHLAQEDTRGEGGGRGTA
ncbi:hypothetical protein [Streptomyces sp. 900105245]